MSTDKPLKAMTVREIQAAIVAAHDAGDADRLEALRAELKRRGYMV